MKSLDEHPAYAAELARLAELTAELDTLVAREVELRATPEPTGSAVDRLLSIEPGHRAITERDALTARIVRLREAIRLQHLEVEVAARAAAAKICEAGLPELRDNVRRQLECLRRLIELSDERRDLVQRFDKLTDNRTAVLNRWPSLTNETAADSGNSFWRRVAEAEELGLIKPGSFGKPPRGGETQPSRYVPRPLLMPHGNMPVY
jgi:hypothetical protein